MNTKSWWSLIIGLFAVIVVLMYFFVAIPVHAPTVGDVVATSTIDVTAPLHTRVVVTTPAQNAVVSKTFAISGEVPGNWYFEASFPIQVLDASNTAIGQGIAQAQSDWMTTEQVPFVAAITVDSYTGPATLVLLRDNPSGLPENDDSVRIPITIQ